MKDFTLTRRTIAAYVGPAAPLSALGLPLVVYVAPFYARDVGLGQDQVGFILLAIRMLDLLLDPLIGWASDETRSAWGRRRPWIMFGLPPYVIGVFLLFMPPENPGLGYFGAWATLTYLAWSVISITHVAWGAELTSHYHERSRVQGWREFALVMGMVLVLLLPALLERFQEGATMHEKLSVMGWFIVIAMPVLAFICVSVVPEPDRPQVHHDLEVSAALRLIASNAPLRRLLFADLMAGLAPGVLAALYLWLIEFWFKLPSAGSTLLFIYFVAGLAGIPFWIWLSYKVSKHRALAYAMLYGACVLPFMLILPQGNFWVVFVAQITLGISYGAGAFLLRAIMADVIDVDTAHSGKERSAVYYSLLIMTNKLGYAAAAIVYPLLTVFGFDARMGEANPPEAVHALALVFVLVPSAFLLLTAAIMWNFPLDEGEQRVLRQRINARYAEAAARMQVQEETPEVKRAAHPSPAPVQHPAD